jgi:hypothetical protein
LVQHIVEKCTTHDGVSSSEPKTHTHHQAEAKDGEFDALSLALGDRLFPFTSSHEVVLVGRMPGCDVMLEKNDTGLSRLHLALFLLPRLGHLCAVDLGGLGVRLLQRKHKELGLPRSSPGVRQQVMMLGLREFAVFHLGDDKPVATPRELVLYPKECVVCADAPRGVKFKNCGHYGVCVKCAAKLDKCPLCRAAVNHAPELLFANRTNLGSNC